MSEHYHCTYCGTALGALDDHGPGETLHCDDCDVDWELVREDEMHDLAVFACPYCGHANKRDQSVETIRCESEDCDLVFDPTGAEVSAVAESDLRTKMRPVGGD